MATELLTIHDIKRLSSGGGTLTPILVPPEPREPWPVWLSVNNRLTDNFPSVTPRRLGIPRGLLTPRAVVAIRIVSPFEREVGGFATKKCDRIYLKHGWLPGDEPRRDWCPGWVWVSAYEIFHRPVGGAL
jgi:hypothetical protein